LPRPWGSDEISVRTRRKELGVRAVFSRVDTCAAEFESFTPYLYSNYETSCEADPAAGKKVMILGSGPNRIGQGIEFDYCCCHASFALQEMGVESIMVNCNPETVSTDYDTSDRLYFEPLTLEHVLNICRHREADGVIVQFGGQTPLNLALPLKRLGVPSSAPTRRISTSPKTRKLFGKLLDRLAIRAPPTAPPPASKRPAKSPRRIGYPVLVRPSYVLGGRAMVIAYDEETVRQYMREAVTFSQERPAWSIASWRTPPKSMWTPWPTATTCSSRHYGAHRRGRRTLRRQLLRAAPAIAGRGEPAHHRRLHVRLAKAST